jgi:hypothetical protein
MATNITVYKPDKPVVFLNVTNISIEGGALTFYWRPSPQGNKKIVTTVPFFVEEDF